MPYGYGYGFRGFSSPWPYIGRGRGGLPRCAYFAGNPDQPQYFRRGPFTRGAPSVTKDQEVDFLKMKANFYKDELEGIEARIKEIQATAA